MGTLTPGNGLQQPASGPRHASVTPNRGITSPDVRRWVYVALGVALVVAEVLGWISREERELILGDVVGLLTVAGLGLAAVNTPSGT